MVWRLIAFVLLGRLTWCLDHVGLGVLRFVGMNEGDGKIGGLCARGLFVLKHTVLRCQIGYSY